MSDRRKSDGFVLSRRQVVGGLLAGTAATGAAAWFFARNDNGEIVRKTASDVQEEVWHPAFLSESQVAAVAALADTIIPSDETPGARDARVHEYIDLALSVETTDKQRAFVSGLEWLEGLAKKRFKRKIAQCTSKQHEELLTAIAEVPKGSDTPKVAEHFFKDLKGRTVIGYYTSEIGWKIERGLPAVRGGEVRGCSRKKV